MSHRTLYDHADQRNTRLEKKDHEKNRSVQERFFFYLSDDFMAEIEVTNCFSQPVLPSLLPIFR